MINIPLQAIPNQSFSIRLGDSFYDINLRMCGASSRVEPFYRYPIMVMDIIRDNAPVVTGQRCVAGFPVIPYRYLESGNFVFVTDDDNLPDFTQFNITQFLIYVSASELATIRAGT